MLRNIASKDDLLSDIFERTWKEAIVAYFKVLSRPLAWKTEENHENLLGCPTFRPGLEAGTSKY
jgi:hypothetical protein